MTRIPASIALLAHLGACVQAPDAGTKPVDTGEEAVDIDTTGDLDCDEADPDVDPGATEICNGIDDNCDGEIDEGVEGTYYQDFDGDGFGDETASAIACDAPEGYVQNPEDCDDAVGTTFPGAVEVCNGVDDNCDGVVDEGGTSTWYPDADGDGYGEGSLTENACGQPEGYADDTDDCDDTDATVNPGAAEIWYDGIDANCDGASDYDADADGDDSLDHGGTDCDDADPARYGGVDCRPVSSCTHPDPTTLAAYDPNGVVDLTFDASCVAWVATIISGADYVYSIDSAGATTILTGESDHDIGSLALDPVGGAVVVSYAGVGALGVQAGALLPVVATGGYASGGNWTNGYMNVSASSIAMDTAGCIWIPNWDVTGSIDCLTTAGVATSLATFGSYVESVALDEHELVYVSEGATLWEVDRATGATTAVYTFPHIVLDMVFDYQGDLYVETTGGEVRVLLDGAASDSLYATVTGEGKLAIAPDGYLVRVESNPVAASSYSEWALGG
ncbi:MAG: putative metal-binding motif-containing protein [Pseudomonadota bacterium]|nr:putative metal-binding motif-containing protein [Pseudomonadota bacterium]